MHVLEGVETLLKCARAALKLLSANRILQRTSIRMMADSVYIAKPGIKAIMRLGMLFLIWVTFV